MAHLSENSNRLSIEIRAIHERDALLGAARHFTDVCLLRLPSGEGMAYAQRLAGCDELVAEVAASLGPEATLIVMGEVIDLVSIHAAVSSYAQYQHWIAIKRNSPVTTGWQALPQYHFGALVYTRYRSALRHAKTRIAYTYCPACHKTTKDYGGKKHTYHEYGTLMSDVWRDLACDLEGDLTSLFERFADFFGVKPYRVLRVLDCRPLNLQRASVEPVKLRTAAKKPSLDIDISSSRLILGDCLQELRKLPDDSVDFAFADPPYNLGKRYSSYTDDRAITEYFAWCDTWIAELARVLRPGRTCAVLNIPLWAIRHFLYLEKVLNFQNWIVWDALSYPVRKIMPAHYAILCFSKGTPRELPGLTGNSGPIRVPGVPEVFKALEPLAEEFCLRSDCVSQRRVKQIHDWGPLTDLWWDVHRLKHNTRRVDHPTQLPPHLMYRLISIFTEPGEVILDCFNGSGTTTLTAHQLDRRYVGIEVSEEYHRLAQNRHAELVAGLNPFRKADRVLTAKNSPVPRMPKRKYVISKKKLQLEVKRVAEQLGHLPNRDEMIEHGRYPIKYYDEYFASWGEVCAAARTTGMSEYPSSVSDQPKSDKQALLQQLSLFD